MVAGWLWHCLLTVKRCPFKYDIINEQSTGVLVHGFQRQYYHECNFFFHENSFDESFWTLPERWEKLQLGPSIKKLEKIKKN